MFLWIHSLGSFSAWSWAEIGAAVIVAIGCIGEMYWVFKKGPRKEEWSDVQNFEEKKARRERVFALLVAFGVTAEVITLIHSLKESGELNLHVQRLTSTNLVLRSNVVALEMRMQPRAITADQHNAIVHCLLSAPKGRVFLLAGDIDGEAKHYKDQLSAAITAGGFKVEPWPDAANILTIGNPGLEMHCTSTMMDKTIFVPTHGEALRNCFAQNGIPISWRVSAYFSVPTNSVLIVVGPRF